MCLIVKKNKLASFCRIFNFTMRKTAQEDIIVYKGLNAKNHRFVGINNDKKQLHGSEFKGIIQNIKCEGKIAVYNGDIYFCTNDYKLDGVMCPDKFEYKYSWIMDNVVQEIFVNDKKLEISFDLFTPYQTTKVEIGKTYNSELSTNNCKSCIEVEKGLHSFEETKPCGEVAFIVVKCKIPKGSKYYVGDFNGNKSYASNALEYLEICNIP